MNIARIKFGCPAGGIVRLTITLSDGSEHLADLQGLDLAQFGKALADASVAAMPEEIREAMLTAQATVESASVRKH